MLYYTYRRFGITGQVLVFDYPLVVKYQYSTIGYPSFWTRQGLFAFNTLVLVLEAVSRVVKSKGAKRPVILDASSPFFPLIY